MTSRSPPLTAASRQSHSRGVPNGVTYSGPSTPSHSISGPSPSTMNGNGPSSSLTHPRNSVAHPPGGAMGPGPPSQSYSGGAVASSIPPPPPLSVGNGGPPMQSPCVLQIITAGQERNHLADSVAHHPRIESLVKLSKDSEGTWLQLGRTAETMGDLDRAVASYESALRHNAFSVPAITNIANILRSKEDFKQASEFFGRVVGITPENGDVWGALGHCFLMIDDLKKAYSSYQQALYFMPNPQEPKLWYGIGILYDRYGSLEHAEEAFSSVIRMDPGFEKANEIFFRLGIIYKQQRKSTQSLECFRYILTNPPRPLTEIDIWFQIGHVYEQQKDYPAAKESYERVLAENPAHAKVLQQLGGLYHRSQAPFYNPETSVTILTKSLESDANDPFSWYLLGRAYMTTTNFGKAYEAYQQAVYRDGKNPAFWCSIGVLYYNINQYHDALDAYSRAIRIHPYLSEVWFNLGALYESCNDQMSDAIDAYQRTLQLEPGNALVAGRLREIRDHQTNGASLSAPPQPKDISPSSLSWTYAANMAATPGNDELSPALGRPLTAGGPPPSPPAGYRFEGLPPMGARPHSTDPYRQNGNGDRRASGHGGPPHHSPAVVPEQEQSPRANLHRLSGPSQSMLPQIKPLHDQRGSPTMPHGSDINRRNSPLSPRTRHSESGPDHGGHVSHYGGSFNAPPFHRGSAASNEEMDWERERAVARNGSIGSNAGRMSGQSHRRSPPGSSHSRDPFPYGGGAPGPYERHIPSPSTSHHGMDDREHRNGSMSGPPSAYPPAYHYGPAPNSFDGPPQLPPRRFDPRDAAEEEDWRRSSVGLRAAAEIDAPAAGGPSTPGGSTSSSKGRGPRGGNKKDENGSSSKKEGTSAAAPKGRRAPKDAESPAGVKKERKPSAAQRAEGGLAGGSGGGRRGKSVLHTPVQDAPPSRGGSASPPPHRAASPNSAAPQASAAPAHEPVLSREVDEDYDDQSDAMILMKMASGSTGSSSHGASPHAEGVPLMAAIAAAVEQEATSATSPSPPPPREGSASPVDVEGHKRLRSEGDSFEGEASGVKKRKSSVGQGSPAAEQAPPTNAEATSPAAKVKAEEGEVVSVAADEEKPAAEPTSTEVPAPEPVPESASSTASESGSKGAAEPEPTPTDVSPPSPKQTKPAPAAAAGEVDELEAALISSVPPVEDAGPEQKDVEAAPPSLSEVAKPAEEVDAKMDAAVSVAA